MSGNKHRHGLVLLVLVSLLCGLASACSHRDADPSIPSEAQQAVSWLRRGVNPTCGLYDLAAIEDPVRPSSTPGAAGEPSGSARPSTPGRGSVEDTYLVFRLLDDKAIPGDDAKSRMVGSVKSALDAALRRHDDADALRAAYILKVASALDAKRRSAVDSASASLPARVDWTGLPARLEVESLRQQVGLATHPFTAPTTTPDTADKQYWALQMVAHSDLLTNGRAVESAYRPVVDRVLTHAGTYTGPSRTITAALQAANVASSFSVSRQEAIARRLVGSCSSPALTASSVRAGRPVAGTCRVDETVSLRYAGDLSW